MKIKWFGKNSFQINGTDVSLAIDPISPEIEAEIVVQTESSDLKIDKEDLISWPGEYEIKDVIVHAEPIGTGAEEKKIISFEVDGIRLCAMARISETPDTKLISKLGDIDILFMPMTIDPKIALETIEEFDPRLVILSDFRTNNDPEAPILADFLKEIGQTGLEAEDQIEVKSRSGLDAESTVYKYLNL